MSEHDAGLIEMACAIYSRALTDTLDPKKAMCAALDAINAAAAAETRIAELEAHQVHLCDALHAGRERIAELEYLDTWAHHNGLNIKEAEQRAENIIQQAIGGLLWSKEAFERNREVIKSYLVDQFKEQASRIADLERENEALRHDIERHIQIASDLASEQERPV